MLSVLDEVRWRLSFIVGIARRGVCLSRFLSNPYMNQILMIEIAIFVRDKYLKKLLKDVMVINLYRSMKCIVVEKVGQAGLEPATSGL